ncbi:MAG: cytidine deaminase [Pseudomonadota bacterium]
MNRNTAPNDLVDAAHTARNNAHAPYSGFFVGAALRDESGAIHIGCNVENAAYPEGNCAETSAIASMVVSGARRITDVVIIGGTKDDIAACMPCGGCRQRLLEFADAQTTIWCADALGGELKAFSMSALLPAAFDLDADQ